MKTRVWISVVVLFVFQGASSQTDKKVLVAQYSLYPYSSTFFEGERYHSAADQALDLALRRTWEFKYTLLVDFKSGNSVFVLDSIVKHPIKGYSIDPQDVIAFAYQKGGCHYKKETLLDSEFFTHSCAGFSYEWEISDETQKIAGFNCTQAVSNTNKDNRIIVWFTSEIPINDGPLNLYGLPGLILQAEDFFKTATIVSIDYQSDLQGLHAKIGEYEKKYKSEKGKDEIKESIFLLQKAGLVKQLKKMLRESKPLRLVD